MSIVRYISDAIREDDPNGCYRIYPNYGYWANCRYKLTETEYNDSTRVSKLKIELQVKASIRWSDIDTASFSGITVSINGTAIPNTEWTKHARSTTDNEEWVTVNETEQTLAARESGNNSVLIGIAASNIIDGNKAAWTYNGSYYFAAAVVGTYTMPLSGNSGSAVYIGGERYNVYIGNGSTWERYNAYIGTNGAWERY